MSASNQGDYLSKAVEWRRLGALALVAYVLGFLGFLQHFSGNFTNFKDWLDFLSKISDSAYYALQMLVLNTPTLEKTDTTPLLLHLGRLLAALVFFWAIGKILFKIFSWDVRGIKLKRLKNHVIICGLGELGLPLALQAQKSGKSKACGEFCQKSSLPFSSSLPSCLGPTTCGPPDRWCERYSCLSEG